MVVAAGALGAGAESEAHRASARLSAAKLFCTGRFGQGHYSTVYFVAGIVPGKGLWKRVIGVAVDR